jgi:hypothetical protein
MSIEYKLLIQGTISGCLFIGLSALIFSFPDYFPETLVGTTFIDAIIVLLILHSWYCGAYLWFKGFTRFKSQLSNPLVKLLYLSFNVFAGYLIYYRNRSTLVDNS